MCTWRRKYSDGMSCIYLRWSKLLMEFGEANIYVRYMAAVLETSVQLVYNPIPNSDLLSFNSFNIT